MTSDAIPVLDGGKEVYLLTPTRKIDLIDNAPNPEAAVSVLRQAISPDFVKTNPVIVMCNGNFTDRRNFVAALQKAGYTNVETLNPLCIVIATSISQVPLKCVIDEPVLFIYSDIFLVIKKCESGYLFIDTPNGFRTAFNRNPSIRNVVSLKDTPELDALKKSCPDITFHRGIIDDDQFKENYIRSYVNNTNPDRRVFSPCNFDLQLAFGNEVDTIRLMKRLPPFTITKEFDVGDAPEVRIFAMLPELIGKAESLPVVKIFTFKTKAFRNVSITVTVDKTLLPQVMLKTISTYEPTVNPNPNVFVVRFDKAMYELGAVYPDQKTNEGSFDTVDKLVAYMSKTFSTVSTASIYFIDSPNTYRSDLRKFQLLCQKAGCSKVKFIPSLSLNLSLVLDAAEVSIEADQVVAMLSPKMYRIIRRDGKYLKVIKRDEASKFDVNETKVDVIVIDNVTDVYTKTDLDYLRAKFSQCAVYVASETEQLKSRLPAYLWSLANETDFGGNIFYNFGDFEFVIEENGAIMEGIDIARFTRFPYVLTITYHVRFANKLFLNLETLDGTLMEKVDEYSVKPGNVVQLAITVKSACDITTKMDILHPYAAKWDGPKHSVRELSLPKKKKKKKVVESPEAAEPENIPSTSDVTAKISDSNENLPKQVSELTLNPPNAVFTFTSDNRVLIEVDETYTGVKEVLAYVRLRVGKEPQVGTKAFDALKKHPASVFYGITRLLATDFDPDHPDPSWGFKTARDADGKVVIRSADDITTFPIVLFGLVIQSTLLYIREHTKSDVKSIGLKLPTGSTVSADELKEVSKRIGVKLSLIVTP